jgi:hypothetical protein
VHHIVVPLHKSGGFNGENLELRYVLRALDRHFKGDFDLTIVGPKLPKWLSAAKLIQTGAGLKTAIRMAADEYPDGFFWWYDDVVLLRDATPEELKVTFAKPGLKGGATGWSKCLAQIAERLKKEGIEPWDYSHPHGPYWFDKGMVDEGFEDWPGMKGKFPWESWILSKRDWPRRRGPYRQVYGDFKEPRESDHYLNFNAKGFSEKLRDWLDDRYPDSSQLEIADTPGVEMAIEIESRPSGSRRAISFSLYGKEARYSAGMVLNAMLAPEIYPGWEVVCHIEQGHYSVDRLRSLGVRVIEHAAAPGQRGAAWRYETGDEAERYDHVIFRDADSRLNPREKAAVDSWLAAGKSLHVMRDHVKHTTPILSGMFGVRTGAFSFSEMLDGWTGGKEFGEAEALLSSKLWPALSAEALVHSHSPVHGEHPFPEHTEWGGFVGRRERPELPGRVRMVYLSPDRYAARRERFLNSLQENGGFLNDLTLERAVATPIEKSYIPATFKKFRGQRHWWAATRDHVEIMETTLAADYDWLFMFEDDASFTPEFNELFWRAFASLPPKWKAMRIGWNAKWDKRRGGNPVIHPGVLHRCNVNGQGMYATFWNRTGLERFYDHMWHRRKMLIDEAFEDLRRKEPRDWYQPAKRIVEVDQLATQLGNDH